MVDREATTLLVVDDDADMRLLIRCVMDLAGDGFVIVAEAIDGIQALDRWRGLDGPPAPDVIILDNRMPNRSGVEVAQEILSERPDQRIVLFSAFLNDNVRAEAREVGISLCLTKEDVAQLPALLTRLRRGSDQGEDHVIDLRQGRLQEIGTGTSTS